MEADPSCLDGSLSLSAHGTVDGRLQRMSQSQKVTVVPKGNSSNRDCFGGLGCLIYRLSAIRIIPVTTDMGPYNTTPSVVNKSQARTKLANNALVQLACYVPAYVNSDLNGIRNRSFGNTSPKTPQSTLFTVYKHLTSRYQPFTAQDLLPVGPKPKPSPVRR